MSVKILHGDCRELIKTLPDQSVNCIVTSPPYFGLRDYGVDGQIGLEETPDAFVAEMVSLFRECRRVLRDDGVFWLNLGDSYAGSGKGGNPDPGSSKQSTNKGSQSVGSLYGTGKTQRDVAVTNVTRKTFEGIKAKDLIGIPWMVAFALRADGWYLRQDIVWSKPNPMPESVNDRCTRAHEYIFMFSKSNRYWYDADAIAEPAIYAGLTGQDESGFKDAKNFSGKHANAANSFRREKSKRAVAHIGQSMGTHRPDRKDTELTGTRNKRSVWEVATKPFAEAHFATFPPKLIEPCILAGCPKGGMVLDPFGGAGTTGLVSDRLGRDAILFELNPEYRDIALRRLQNDAGMFADVSAA